MAVPITTTREWPTPAEIRIVAAAAIKIAMAGAAAVRHLHRRDAEGWQRFCDAHERTGYHEAGHAVAMLLAGVPLGSVSVRADATSLGRVLPRDLPQSTTRTDQQQIEHDLRLAWRDADREERRAILQKLHRETAELIEANWEAVSWLAGELVKRSELTGEEAEAILARAGVKSGTC